MSGPRLHPRLSVHVRKPHGVGRAAQAHAPPSRCAHARGPHVLRERRAVHAAPAAAAAARRAGSPGPRGVRPAQPRRRAAGEPGRGGPPTGRQPRPQPQARGRRTGGRARRQARVSCQPWRVQPRPEPRACGRRGAAAGGAVRGRGGGGGGPRQLQRQLRARLLAAAGRARGRAGRLRPAGAPAGAHWRARAAAWPPPSAFSSARALHAFDTPTQLLSRPLRLGTKRRDARRRHARAARQACDAFGNRRAGGGDGFQAAVRGGEPGAARVEDRGDGTYAVTYALPAEGAYRIAVTGPDARHVRGSPVAVTVFRCARASEPQALGRTSRACTFQHHLQSPCLSVPGPPSRAPRCGD